MLYAQKARSKYLGQTEKSMEGREDYMKRTAASSIRAYREIQELTHQYNALGGGKWTGIMNMMPRDLPVFNPPTLPYLPEDLNLKAPALNTSTPKDDDFIACNAADHDVASKECQSIQMLGHSMNAVSIPKGSELVYYFTTQKDGDATLYTAMIPTQPNDKGDLNYSVQIDNTEPVIISLKEKYRSEFWKVSVLRGQALKETPVKISNGQHTLKIKALDDHIIADQWMLDFKKDRKFYVIPAKKTIK
jgi:hypothetical protein